MSVHHPEGQCQCIQANLTKEEVSPALCQLSDTPAPQPPTPIQAAWCVLAPNPDGKLLEGQDFPHSVESRLAPYSSLVAKSSPTLANPWTRACQAPLSMGFPRQEYWSGLGIEPESPALAGRLFSTELPGTLLITYSFFGKSALTSLRSSSFLCKKIQVIAVNTF